MNKKNTRLLSLAIAFIALPLSVHAACSALTDGVVPLSRFNSQGDATVFTLATATSATATVEGALAYDTTNDVLKSCDGTSWNSVGSGGSSSTADRITSGTTSVIVNSATSAISFTTAGTQRMVIDSSGNVGIGTSSPAGKLHVVGDAVIGTAANPYQLLGDASSLHIRKGVLGGVLFGFHGVASVGSYLPFAVGASYWGVTPPANGAIIQGNVGIGTTAPAATLQVSGSFIVSTSAQTTTPSLYVGTSGFVGIGMNNPALPLEINGAMRINTGSIYMSTNQGIVWGDTHADIYALSNSLMFRTNSFQERMRIDSSGNVGIGTTAPSGTLHVSGTVAMTRYSGAPVACSAAYNGLMAMTSAARLCACDGTSWKYADSTGSACSW